MKSALHLPEQLGETGLFVQVREYESEKLLGQVELLYVQH